MVGDLGLGRALTVVAAHDGRGHPLVRRAGAGAGRGARRAPTSLPRPRWPTCCCRPSSSPHRELSRRHPTRPLPCLTPESPFRSRSKRCSTAAGPPTGEDRSPASRRSSPPSRLAPWPGLAEAGVEAGCPVGPRRADLTQPGRRPGPGAGLPPVPKQHRQGGGYPASVGLLVGGHGAGWIPRGLRRQRTRPGPDVDRDDDSLTVTVPHAWDGMAATAGSRPTIRASRRSRWAPAGAGPQALTATASSWGFLPGGELPEQIPQHGVRKLTPASSQSRWTGGLADRGLPPAQEA